MAGRALLFTDAAAVAASNARMVGVGVRGGRQLRRAALGVRRLAASACSVYVLFAFARKREAAATCLFSIAGADVGSSSQADYHKINSAMDDSIGGS